MYERAITIGFLTAGAIIAGLLLNAGLVFGSPVWQLVLCGVVALGCVLSIHGMFTS